MLKNIRNSYDCRSTNHHGNLFAVAFCFAVAIFGLIVGLTENGDARSVCIGVAAVSGVFAFILGVIWLDARQIYFSENPEDLPRDPQVQAREVIERARRMSRGS